MILNLCVPLLGITMLNGCGLLESGGGSLTVTSREHSPLEVETNFDAGFYAQNEKNALTVVLIEGSTDNPSAAAILRMFWPPNAGQTTIDQAATNVTVQYLAFGPSLSERRSARHTDQVGLYDGAGFFYLNSDPGASRLHASLWQANLQLSDRSKRFTDHTGQSFLAGSISATRDDVKVQTLLKALNHMLRERLGYPRLIHSDKPTALLAHGAPELVPRFMRFRFNRR